MLRVSDFLLLLVLVVIVSITTIYGIELWIYLGKLNFYSHKNKYVMYIKGAATYQRQNVEQTPNNIAIITNLLNLTESQQFGM